MYGAFSLAFEGASGSTQNEIQSVFHFIKDDGIRRKAIQEILLEINRQDKKIHHPVCKCPMGTEGFFNPREF